MELRLRYGMRFAPLMLGLLFRRLIWMLAMGLRITPNDGFMDGAFLEESITVQNSIPVINAVGVSPSSGVFNDTALNCYASASDVDQAVIPTYEWDVNGVAYTGSYLALSTTNAMPGDLALCTATVTDNNGATVSSNASVLVENRAPSVGGLTITPSTNVTTQTAVACSSTTSDLDGELPVLSYAWNVNGQSVGTGSNLDLQTVTVSPGDALECVATATDASGDTASVNGSITITNTAPTIDSLTLTPLVPGVNDTLTCTASASDVDGGTPALAFGFEDTVSGTVFPASTTTTTNATLDLNTLTLVGGAEIECSVTATDADGGTVSDAISVLLVSRCW